MQSSLNGAAQEGRSTKDTNVVGNLNDFQKDLLAKSSQLLADPNWQKDSADLEVKTNSPGLLGKEMPIKSLPVMVQKIVNEYASCLNFAPEYLVSGMLCATSGALGNTHRVSTFSSAWTEPAMFYVAVVGSPGVGKTAPLNAAMNPLRKRDDQTHNRYLDEVEAFKVSEQIARDAKKMKLQPFPTWHKILVSDATPEALASKHAENPRGLVYYVDELLSWVNSFDRYNNRSAVEMWLSIYSSNPINIDRKGAPPIYIPHPCVTVIGTIQPKVLAKIAKEGRGDNGFLDRILWVYPRDIKKQYWQEKCLSEDVPNLWRTVINKVLDLDYTYNGEGKQVPKVISFSPEAYKAIKKWHVANTDRINADESYAGIGAKIEIYALRLSLVLQAMFYGCGEGVMTEVELPATNAAIAFADYFAGQAVQIRSAMGGDDPTAILTDEKKRLYTALPQIFETSHAISIGEKLGIHHKAVTRFLSKEPELFSKVKHGYYQKK